MASTRIKSPKKTHYIFVLGGVMSGVGKGITTASLGTILQSKGLKVSLMKADPYLNVDAGTMNPTEHGEVFVMDSGLETDQDMGNYERFLNTTLPPENYMTNRMVFQYVINKERALGYNGDCVEPTYHITEEILRRIQVATEKSQPDVLIIEVGGTVGEYQNAIFLEAGRRLKIKYRDRVLFAMVSYLPLPSKLGEMKTKPTQNAVRQLNSYGIQPDFIIARAEKPVDNKRKKKISDMTGVLADHVISAPDIDSIYQVPLNFERDGFAHKILTAFGMSPRTTRNDAWKKFVSNMHHAQETVRIAVVGKYFSTGDFVLSDAYISVIEALKISGAHNKVKVKLDWLDASLFEKKSTELRKLDQYHGICVPGGFGSRGIEGIINVIEYARRKKIPYFGLCYGMQLLVVEYARHMAGMKNAHTVEMNKKTPYPVIDILPEQIAKLADKNMGGSMRLGSYPCVIQKGTLAEKAYRAQSVKNRITERHRHRYEVNPEYVDQLEKSGLIFSGTSPDTKLMEIAELPTKIHPFFLGAQFHPEFLARPLSPHPLFSAFISAAKKKGKNKKL